MGSLTDYAENAFLQHLFDSAYTAPSAVYLGLCTADPTDAATGASCNEVPDASNYARTQITFGAAAGRQIVQNADVIFPILTGSITGITHWVITDSPTYGAGNVLVYGSFNTSFSLVSGNALRIASGQAVITANTNSTKSMTTYAVHALLNLMFRNVAFASPANNTYIALLVTNCAESYTTMAEVTEVTGSAYARAKVNPAGGTSPAWNEATAGVVSNADTINFTTPTGDWTTITAMAIVTAASGTAAFILFFDNSLTDQTPVSGDLVYYNAETLTVTVA